LFRLQYEHNKIYKIYVDALKIDPLQVREIEEIPFLPIEFFKSGGVTTSGFVPEVIFESSGTTAEKTSRHFVKKMSVYEESFMRGFKLVYGNPSKFCILGLLPGYLERKNSSLIFMVDGLIRASRDYHSGFYLHNHEKLYQTLIRCEIKEQPVLLVGVTFALLDFAEKFSIKLNYTTVMETGGMKGRREEITREQVHSVLKQKLGLKNIHSEYGMTELLSQAYSKNKGLFYCPPWMKVMIREENDPFAITARSPRQKPSSGLLNIIDFANIYSCCFIATDDVGRLHQNGSFEVLGRSDTSDIRGCGLLTLNE
jgi:Acyl-protein synthetase, LuxE